MSLECVIMVLIGLASSANIYVYKCQKPSGYHMMTNGPRLFLSSHVISGRELEELEEWPLNAAYPKETFFTTITEDLFLNKFSVIPNQIIHKVQVFSIIWMPIFY